MKKNTSWKFTDELSITFQSSVSEAGEFGYSPMLTLAFLRQTSASIQGQEPLTASMLAQAPPSEQKQMLGERLFPLIQTWHSELAGKITGMLLEIDNSELVHMLEHQESLKAKVEEAVVVLQAHKQQSDDPKMNNNNYA